MSEAESRNELDRDVDASMRMFEQSQVGDALTILPIRPSRVLLVLDGSPQDDASIAAATTLRERFNTETVVLDAREEIDADLAGKRAAEVSGSRPIDRGDGSTYDVILAAVATHDVDLVVLPCPFGRPLDQVGTDSAGTVIDVLLSRLKTAMLVIRREDMRLGDCASRVALVVGGECEMLPLASRWVFGLANPKATVSLNLVLEKEAFENMRSIFEAIHPETPLDEAAFGEAMTKTHASLHGSMAKTARASEMNYRLLPQAGEVAPPNPLQDDERMMLVMPLEVDDRFTQGFVQDRIRRSPHPVLIVPGHLA